MSSGASWVPERVESRPTGRKNLNDRRIVPRSRLVADIGKGSTIASPTRRAWPRALLAVLDRYPVVTITFLCVGAALLHLGQTPISWRFFRTAGQLVLGGDLLHTYVTHPNLQFGPLAFLVSAPLALLPSTAEEVVSAAVMIVLGVLTLFFVRRSFPPLGARSSAAWWAAAAIGALAWAELAMRYGHLDDALALTLVAAAVFALRKQRYAVSAVLLALSVDAKPWTVPLVALLLLADRRRWFPLIALWAGVVAAFWAPFIMESLHSLNAVRFSIPIAPASPLRLLNLDETSTPLWCRPVQMGVGLLLAILAIRRRSIAVAVLSVFAVRLLFDPGVWGYYDIEVVLGAILCDLSLLRGRIPMFTIVAVAFVYAPSYVLTDFPQVHVWVSVVGLMSLVVMAFGILFRTPRAALLRTRFGEDAHRLHPSWTPAPLPGRTLPKETLPQRTLPQGTQNARGTLIRDPATLESRPRLDETRRTDSPATSSLHDTRRPHVTGGAPVGVTPERT